MMFGGGRCGIWSDDDNDGTSSEEEETDYIRRRWDEDMEDDKDYEVEMARIFKNKEHWKAPWWNKQEWLSRLLGQHMGNNAS